jgi:hypothetical protein
VAAPGGDRRLHRIRHRNRFLTWRSPERQRIVTLGQREWTAEPGLLRLTVHKGQPIRVVAFRSGGGITSLLQEEPPALFEFPYDSPAWPQAEVWRSPKSASRRDLPVDLVAVTAEGLSVFVDRDGIVRTISVSGYRTLVKHLDPADSVTSACAIDLHAVAYVSAMHPDTIFLTPLAPSPAAAPLALDAEARGTPWSTYRLTSRVCASIDGQRASRARPIGYSRSRKTVSVSSSRRTRFRHPCGRERRRDRPGTTLV